MTHPLFGKEPFIETPFTLRFQAMLRSSLSKRSWHVLVADPGSGKTTSVRELTRTTGAPAILAVTSPKNDDDEQALGDKLFTVLGVKLPGHWRVRKPKLIGYLHQYGTKLIVVDDAHDLSLEHLMFLKEVTDQGRLQYNHALGLCLVAAGRGNTIPLKEILDQPETMWLQFRRRMDKLEPFCRIAGHTSEEVREVLAALETVYRELFPQLNLRRWSGSIYNWLTQSHLDPANSGRVTMDNLMKLVTTALEWTYEAGQTDVQAETLEQAAELLVLRRNTLRIIDGAGPIIDDQNASPEGSIQTIFEDAEKKDQTRSGKAEQVPESAVVESEKQPARQTKCTFSGVVPIDLQQFLGSGTSLVECPDCTSTSSLTPHKGILQFKPHKQRKTRSTSTESRWAKREMIWTVVNE